MDKCDQEDFKKRFRGLGELYNKEISEALIKIYWLALKGVSLQQFNNAISLHLVNPKNGCYFPKPADIMAILTLSQQPIEDRANIAWMEIETAIRRTGTYGNLKLEDKQALMAVKSCGGWVSICATNMDKMQWKKKEFIEVYLALENTLIELLPKSLDGIAALENQRKNGINSMQKLLSQNKSLKTDV